LGKDELRTFAKQLAVGLADSAVGRRIFLRRSRELVPVFMLHRFRNGDSRTSGHDPQLVSAALDYLLDQGFRVLGIDEVVQGLVAGTLPERAVAFTMDDGYLDQGRIGAEIFLARGCPATIYLVTGMTDGRLWPWEAKLAWLFSRARSEFHLTLAGRSYRGDPSSPGRLSSMRRELVHLLKVMPLARADAEVRRLAETMGEALPDSPPEQYRALDWAEVRSLEQRGVSFGSHTVSHVTLSAEDDETARRELAESTRQIREQLQRPSRVFCYPTGRSQDYGAREVGFLRELGYEAAITSEPGYCSLGSDATRASTCAVSASRTTCWTSRTSCCSSSGCVPGSGWRGAPEDAEHPPCHRHHRPRGAETVFVSLAEHFSRPPYRSIAMIRGPGWVKSQLDSRGFRSSSRSRVAP
jgi:peptidoglycan/xylan/chitin deacetylase (PgdA/CDA1 family)